MRLQGAYFEMDWESSARVKPPFVLIGVKWLNPFQTNSACACVCAHTDENKCTYSKHIYTYDRVLPVCVVMHITLTTRLYWSNEDWI